MPEIHKTCTDCGREFGRDEIVYLCPDCSPKTGENETACGLIEINYDHKKVAKELNPKKLKESKIEGQARYLPLLPIKSATSLPPLQVGPTPLDEVKRLRAKYDVTGLFIKNDTCLPTGSFKDRASSIVVAKARELGRDIVATASTGNAATALAGMSASIGMKSVIFVPASAPKAKLTQIAMFGARLIPVDGTYDDAFGLCLRASEKFGWYNRNTGYNPYTIDGKKTAALEIWEQLGYKAPDKVFIPTGDGVILAGIYKGFFDLKEMGFIDKIPQMIPVQAEGSAAIVDSLELGLNTVTKIHGAQTIADSICVNSPACGNMVLTVVHETHGFGVKVTDDEILSAMKELASMSGIFAEPAASAAYAGFIKCAESGKIKKGETVIVMITGTGLKDIPAAMKAIEIPKTIPPDIDAIKEVT